MSWRAEFSRPGLNDPYLKVYHRLTGVYHPDEIVPIPPCTFETVRDDFPDVAALTLSRPPVGPRGDWMEAGDWVRIWLPGDAENDPTYLGEITNDPWFEGQGTVNLRSLKGTVGKAAWSAPLAADGTRPNMTGKFRDFFTRAIALAAPSVPVGSIPDDPADMAGNPDFELLETTLKNAEYVIDNGSWGVSAAGTLDVRRPDAGIHFNFREGECDTTPGTWENYFNCLRFPFTRPDGTEGIYAGRNPAEVARRGQEVWDQTNVPSRLQAAHYVALPGQSADVVTHVTAGGATVDLASTKPVFQSDWSGLLADPPPPLKAGLTATVSTQDQSLIRLVALMSVYEYTGGPGRGQVVHVVVLDVGRYPVTTVDGVQIDALEARIKPDGGEWSAWEPLALYTPDYENTQGMNASTPGQAQAFTLPRYPNTLIGSGRATFEIRYSQAWLAAFPDSPGVRLWNTSIVQNGAWNETARLPDFAFTLESQVQLADTFGMVGQVWNLYEAGGGEGYTNPMKSQDAVLLSTVSPVVTGVTVHPDAPVTWEPSSAIQATAGQGASVTATVNDGVPLVTLPDPPEGVQRWAYQGNATVTLDSINFSGDVTRLGRLQLEVMDTARLDMYAIARLSRYTQPERNWTGWGYDLRRVPCRGGAQFHHPPGDQVLDVQRVRYNLLPGPGEKAWVVECGTAYPSEDEDAIANALDSVKREAQA